MMAKIGKLPGGAADLARRIVLLKYEAGRMGLYKTMHALEPATQAIGWEMAEILEGKRGDHLQGHPENDPFESLVKVRGRRNDDKDKVTMGRPKI